VEPIFKSGIAKDLLGFVPPECNSFSETVVLVGTACLRLAFTVIVDVSCSRRAAGGEGGVELPEPGAAIDVGTKSSPSA